MIAPLFQKEQMTTVWLDKIQGLMLPNGEILLAGDPLPDEFIKEYKATGQAGEPPVMLNKKADPDFEKLMDDMIEESEGEKKYLSDIINALDGEKKWLMDIIDAMEKDWKPKKVKK